MLHLIYIPFRGVGIDLRDDRWFKDRIEIFKKYTLESLRKQTNQNFIIWLSFREEDEGSIRIKELTEYMRSINLAYVLTFNGLMYHDDKFSRDFKTRVKNFGRVLRWCYRNSWKDIIQVKHIFNDKNESLKERLSKSLDTLKRYFSGVDWVIMTRIDSDDMFHRDAVKIIQSYPLFTGALVCKKGFIYNTSTKQMAEWKPFTNPPFHSIIFTENMFFDVDTHLLYYKDFKSHEDITRVFETRELPDYFYCVTTHNPKNHISTIWDHPFKGDLVNSELINLYK